MQSTEDLNEKSRDLANTEEYGTLHEQPEATIERSLTWIDQGADVHILGDWALRYTISYGTLEQVKQLVERYGGKINVPWEGNAFWDSSIWRACRLRRIEILKYLLEKGADTHILENSAWRIATQHKFEDVLVLLRKYQKHELDAYTLSLFQYWKELNLI